MSQKTTDGGTAFPYEWESSKGMSLRDYFAGQVVAGLLANSSYEDYDPGTVAHSAYDMAEAMLAERTREPS